MIYEDAIATLIDAPETFHDSFPSAKVENKPLRKIHQKSPGALKMAQ
jgi:hypothetical protein